LAHLDYRSASDFVDIIGSLFSRGENDTSLDFIAECLDRKPKSLERLIPPPGKGATTVHMWAHGKIERILRSPVLRRVLCKRKTNSRNLLHPDSKIFARLNRAELGDFDARVLGLFFKAHFKGQIVVEDLGFYGRDMHETLVRENQLIAGGSMSASAKRRNCPRRCRSSETESQAGRHSKTRKLSPKLAGLRSDRQREDNPYNRFVEDAVT